MKCNGKVKAHNPYLAFLASFPEEAGEDAEDGLDLLFGLRSWLGWAGSLKGPGSSIMTRAARKKEKRNK